MLTDPPQPPTSFGPAFLCSLSSFACSRTGDGIGDTAPSEGIGDTAPSSGNASGASSGNASAAFSGDIDSDPINHFSNPFSVIGF